VVTLVQVIRVLIRRPIKLTQKILLFSLLVIVTRYTVDIVRF